VARRRAAQRAPGGGGGIQALRQARARITLALLSACAYGGVFAWALVYEHERFIAPATATLGGVGALVLAWLLWRGGVELVVWPLGLLGTAYAIAVVVHGSSVDDTVPLVAAGLLLCGELAAWSIDERFAISAETAVVAGRAAGIALLTLAGLGISALVVALAAAPAGSSLAWTVVGSLAAVSAVGLGVALARRV
jgi:hypothetical protein